MGIDPLTKVIVFSDGLTIKEALDIVKYFNKRIKTSCGIGTHITNDFPDFKALQIVLKMLECNGRPVAKLSNNPAKRMCRSKSYMDYLEDTFQKRIKM